MPTVSKAIGLVLFLLGIISYIATGGVSFTALIPSAFGLVFLGLGFLGARSESMRKHAMHAALLLAIFGIIGTFGGLMSVLNVLSGTPLERPAAAYSQALMAILCIYFVVMGIRSFINARKAPAATPSSEEGGDSPQS